MATTTGSHPVATFTSPINGTSPIDANAVRNNDNAVRSAYVNHDADTGIHVQSSTLALRPAASVAGRKWMTIDGSDLRLWIDTGTAWVETAAAKLSSAQTFALTGDVTGSVSSNLSSGASIATTLADNTVTSAKIVNGTIVNADISGSAGIELSKLATGALPTSITVASANIVDGTIVDADVNASAAIAYSKLAALSSANILVGSATNVPTARAVTGDITINNTGVTAIASGVIVDADISASAGIADTKLGTISTAGKVSNSATTATSSNTNNAIVARDGSGNIFASTINNIRIARPTLSTTNTAVGLGTLPDAGDNNTAVGANALRALQSIANNNTAVGTEALYTNTTGNSNTAIGNAALYNNTAGSNTAVGAVAMYSNTSGVFNVAIGNGAMFFSTTGDSNTAVGREAMGNNLNTGSQNTAIGYQSLFDNDTGDDNTAIGWNAGAAITSGSRNVIVGKGADPSAAAGIDQVVVGEGLTGKGNDTAFIGGTNGAYNEKNVTTWETTSDARIKKAIADVTDGLAVIMQVRVRNFEYRTAEEITEVPASAAIDKPGTQIGVIAQELQSVLPLCVTENSTGVLSVNTDPLLWYLISAVQSLAARLASVESA